MRLVPLLVLLFAASAQAQTPGNCLLGRAQADLDIGDVFARVFNTGALFFGNSSVAAYVVPKESGNSPIFSASFWVGGKVDGEIRVSGSRYTRYELWPGPLLDGAVLPSPDDCSAYDRIFVVSRGDVERYYQTGEATDDLRDWPVAWGAPVLDGDGIAGNYDLEAGDQPAILGDQMAWWVTNDVGNRHEETFSNPLGIEVQASAVASLSGYEALDQATLYRYRIVNRSPNVIDSAYVSLHVDIELPFAKNDVIGSDTTRDLAFGYHFTDGRSIYGVPPAIGASILQGPVGLPNERDDDHDGLIDEVGERLAMTAMTHWCGSCSLGTNDPRFAEEYYNHMNGLWSDGTPYTASRGGYQTNGPIIKFAYPGDPVARQCWSQMNPCFGGPNPGWANRARVVPHSGPFRLEPGEAAEVVFALLFGQGADHLDSVTELRRAADFVQNAYDEGFFAPARVERPEEPETPALRLARAAPNPFTDRLTVRYEVPEALPVRLALFDALGREVAVLTEATVEAGEHEAIFDAARLPPGAYVVRFEAAGSQRSLAVVKAR